MCNQITHLLYISLLFYLSYVLKYSRNNQWITHDGRNELSCYPRLPIAPQVNWTDMTAQITDDTLIVIPWKFPLDHVTIVTCAITISRSTVIANIVA
jgi:hypothetical protein